MPSTTAASQHSWAGPIPQFTNNLSTITSCAHTLYAFEILRAHGMSDSALQSVYWASWWMNACIHCWSVALEVESGGIRTVTGAESWRTKSRTLQLIAKFGCSHVKFMLSVVVCGTNVFWQTNCVASAIGGTTHSTNRQHVEYPWDHTNTNTTFSVRV